MRDCAKLTWTELATKYPQSPRSADAKTVLASLGTKQPGLRSAPPAHPRSDRFYRASRLASGQYSSNGGAVPLS